MGSRSAAAVPASTPELLIIASGNPSKVAELQAMLAPVQLRVQQQPEGIDIEETGSTYLENARLKAAEVARLTGHWTLADDSGIAVDALGGAPGLYSARYGSSNDERIGRLLRELGDAPYRSASFHSAVAVANPDGEIELEAEGICRGEILLQAPGQNVGYDSIFWVREAACTYAAMNQHQRSKLGSRGKAMRQIAQRMRQLFGV